MLCFEYIQERIREAGLILGLTVHEVSLWHYEPYVLFSTYEFEVEFSLASDISIGIEG